MTLAEAEEFFKKVFWEKRFYSFITANKLRVMNEPYQKRIQVFKIWSERWHIKSSLPGNETILPHLESHEPGLIHIHVEVDPYEGSVEKVPDRVAYLRPLLDVKASLLSDIRQGVLTNASWVSRFGASHKNLGNCDTISTLSAVRFEMAEYPEVNPTRCAEFYVDVMTDLIPFIEAHMVKYK